MQYVHPCPKPLYKPRRRAGVYIEPNIWDLRLERGQYCEWCEYLYRIGEKKADERNQAETRHHCICPDLIRFHQEVTVIENLMGACTDCHTGRCLLDTKEVRDLFWMWQCQRYGVDHMQDWLRGLPAKLWISGRIDPAYLDGEMSILGASQ